MWCFVLCFNVYLDWSLESESTAHVLDRQLAFSQNRASSFKVVFGIGTKVAVLFDGQTLLAYFSNRVTRTETNRMF